jgi:hypothetical protein
LCEAAELLGLSYRQVKRIWARYRSGGAKALQHGNCGRVSNRAYRAEFRAAVLRHVKARYEDFGPTPACEHMASDDGLVVPAGTLRRCLKQAGGGNGDRNRIDGGGKPRPTLASWCSWTEAFTSGWKNAGRVVV